MEYSYTANGETVVLSVDEDTVAVRFREPAPHSMRAHLASRPELEPFSRRMEVPKEKYTIFHVAKTSQRRKERHLRAFRSMGAEREVARVAPVFTYGESKVLATDRVCVGFLPGTENTKKMLNEMGYDILEQKDDEFLIGLPETEDPFEVVTILEKKDEVAFAEPDLVTIFPRLPRLFSSEGFHLMDPLESRQYAVTITRAKSAWNLQTGNPRIVIAVLDDGVESRHEDLAAAIVKSYDATDQDEFQEPNPWDPHGTACAGLAAAVPGNSLGIRGIGGGCSLMAIRIGFTHSWNGPLVMKNTWISRGIDWAWENGADVLSHSWGCPPSTSVTNALARARTHGRDGKGCVIVQAVGNFSRHVSYPASLDFVLAVSASNEFDEPKTEDSRDGESNWGTNFGPEVDVAAPGVHNYTTDLMGDAGYNTRSQGHYYDGFNGTSSSTPIVAGAVALILSANPDLTEEEARNIIKQTADKVGSVPYFRGRNDLMGYGRLNVENAVLRALGTGGEPTPPGREDEGEAQPANGFLKVQVTASSLRIRSGPGIDYPVIGQLANGEIKTAGDIDGKEIWMEIEPGKWSAYVYNGSKFMKIIK